MSITRTITRINLSGKGHYLVPLGMTHFEIISNGQQLETTAHALGCTVNIQKINYNYQKTAENAHPIPLYPDIISQKINSFYSTKLYSTSYKTISQTTK
jgi:hypothetical protein